MKIKKLAPIHPGEILRYDFMEPLGLTQSALATAIGVTPMRVSQIVRGQRAITADTALRLGRFFSMAPQFWLNLQSHYDLEQEEKRLAHRLVKEVKVLAVA